MGEEGEEEGVVLARALVLLHLDTLGTCTCMCVKARFVVDSVCVCVCVSTANISTFFFFFFFFPTGLAAQHGTNQVSQHH